MSSTLKEGQKKLQCTVHKEKWREGIVRLKAHTAAQKGGETEFKVRRTQEKPKELNGKGKEGSGKGVANSWQKCVEGLKKKDATT